MDLTPSGVIQRAKSCHLRKKYRKMKYDFDIKMRESNQLCGDELKAMKLAKRLQEQNE